MKTPIFMLKLTGIILSALPLLPITSLFGQNALLINRLLVTDHIQVVEKDYPLRHLQFQGIDNLENTNRYHQDLVDIVVDAYLSGSVTSYDYNTFFDPEFPNNYNLAGQPIEVNTDSLREQIRSIVFIEEWSFDKEAFRFIKSVKGIIPVRHSKQDLEPELQKLELTALFLQPDDLSRKETRQVNRRMVHVKEIAYEFVLTEPHLLYIRGAEESVLRELGHAAYKYYNVNWNRYASNTIVEGIIEQSFKEDQDVFELDGKSLYNFDSLPYIVEPWLDSIMEQVMDEYGLTQTMPTVSELKHDLKRNVFSIIFFEDWYIDPETLYMEKRVKAVAPVLWQRRKTAGGAPIDDPETGYPVYFKSILFRIPLN